MSVKRRNYFIILLPIIFLYLFFIGGGIITIIIESVGYIPKLGLDKVSLEYYEKIIGDVGFVQSLLYSLYIASMSALLSTLFGVYLAYWLVNSQNIVFAKFTKRILQVGLILPYLYVVFFSIIMVSRTGFISRLFYQLGIISSLEQFPRLLNENFGLGIILVYILKGTPFIALFVINIIGNISNTYRDIARTLGASKTTILRKIYLPLAANTIAWTSSIIFIYDFGAFEVPFILGTNRFITLSTKLHSLYINPHIDLIPMTMSMNIIMLVVGAIATFIYGFALRNALKGIKL